MSSIIGPNLKYEGQTTEELLESLNRLPLFMTDLDMGDGDGGSNIALEALQALVYEGTPLEIAKNFKAQGNECFATKQYKDAVEFYSKAIKAGLEKRPAYKEGEARIADVTEKVEGQDRATVDALDAKLSGTKKIEIATAHKADEDEDIEEQLLELVTTCYLNRAACNLELKNFRRVLNDCAEVIRAQPTNAKAFYRSARACLAIDKIDEAKDCISRGVALEPQSSYFQDLSIKVMQREDYLLKVEQGKTRREVMKKHVVSI
ncbi:uncharacterized protein V1518DRAFT_412205 [Limtongia smithiae]|uniref:uncharacterized protein n=1 Tax=Limtongia smithiae TaxID=1125753 RepID=UPI0034CDC921